ncbi:MAG: NIL domain-containing protein [Fimbriimonadaceae bacterium]|nr:NIL domain-containing protein [Fimbriimonadaceae bacterium]
MTIVDLNITAGKESVGEPWIWKLCREFTNVKITVRKANIDVDYGWVHLELEGPVEEIQRATAWLMTTGLHVEALQRSVSA